MSVVSDFPCGPYRKRCSPHNTQGSEEADLRFDSKTPAQSPLSDDVRYCASSWNSLAQPSAPLMQWKHPLLFKWLFDLIYFIIQNPEGIWGIVLIVAQGGDWMLVTRLVFLTDIINHKGIPESNWIKLNSDLCCHLVDVQQTATSCPCCTSICVLIHDNTASIILFYKRKLAAAL